MSVQDQDQEETIDFLETESDGFADQEEEAETIEGQEEETIVEQEESHISEVEEIVAEVNRLERRVESTIFFKPLESDSESDSIMSAYCSQTTFFRSEIISDCY